LDYIAGLTPSMYMTAGGHFILYIVLEKSSISSGIHSSLAYYDLKIVNAFE